MIDKLIINAVIIDGSGAPGQKGSGGTCLPELS